MREKDTCEQTISVSSQYKGERKLKKLPISKSVNLTRPNLSVKWFVTFALIVALMTAGLAFGRKIYVYLAGATVKARGHIEESGFLPGE